MPNVYSMFDRKLRAYGQLMLERNDFAIQRSLSDFLASGADALAVKHPEDFDLYQVGYFGEESGKLTPDDMPRLVCNAAELVSRGEEG